MKKLLSKAITLALKAHEGQVDKSEMPYVGHVMRVMAAGRTEDEKIGSAARCGGRYSLDI